MHVVIAFGIAFAIMLAALPTAANAADMLDVLDACKRTPGCYYDCTETTCQGCSPIVCFVCNGKTCEEAIKSSDSKYRAIGGNVLKALAGQAGAAKPPTKHNRALGGASILETGPTLGTQGPANAGSPLGGGGGGAAPVPTLK
jgi:hypothetical protein